MVISKIKEMELQKMFHPTVRSLTAGRVIGSDFRESSVAKEVS